MNFCIFSSISSSSITKYSDCFFLTSHSLSFSPILKSQSYLWNARSMLNPLKIYSIYDLLSNKLLFSMAILKRGFLNLPTHVALVIQPTTFLSASIEVSEEVLLLSCATLLYPLKKLMFINITPLNTLILWSNPSENA